MGKVKEEYVEMLERFINNLPTVSNDQAEQRVKVINYTREYYKKDINGNSHYYYSFYKVDSKLARVININFNIHQSLLYYGKTGFNDKNGKFTGYDTKAMDVQDYLNKLIIEVLGRNDIYIYLNQI